MKRFFKYIEPLWLGKDKKMSLRNLGALGLMIDFVVNMHISSTLVGRMDKITDPAIVAAMSGNLAQISFMLITEASLIAALLALRTWQNSKEGFVNPSNTPVLTNVQQPTVINQNPIEQVN